MKILVVSVVSLLLGVAIGWYAERHHSEHEKTEIVQQMVEGGESSDRYKAVLAARAIESIESGNPQEAVRLLSTPVAHYYSVYTEAGGKDERRAEIRALIEQLASTNQVVAARIAEVMQAATTHSSKTP
jgi:hypothetical protein